MPYITPRIFVANITFNSGQTITFNRDDIVVFVGANNVGKSQTLEQIISKASNPNAPSPPSNTVYTGNYQSNARPHQIIRRVELMNEGTIDDYCQWTQNNFTLIPQLQGNYSPQQYRGSNNVTLSGEEYYGVGWDGLQPNAHGHISYVNHFWKSLQVMERLNGLQDHMMDHSYDIAQNTIQEMYKSLEKEKEYSSLFKETFGVDIILNRFSGSGQIPIHIGERPEPSPDEDYFSPDFARRFRDLPLLSSQGNGMRAFFSLLVSTVGVTEKSAFFIDEPEVFLHPPQARKLGKFLAEKTAGNAQLFMATHNGAFIRGLLDAGSERIRVIRIDRDGDNNPIHQLENIDIQNLWSDSVLKYTDALDGLFHKRVVVCESDSDCRFFAAMSSANNSRDAEDTMFIGTGGKDRAHVVIKALKSVGVDVKAALDFDVINQVTTMKRTVEALGGEWGEIESDFNLVKTSVENKRPELSTNRIFEEIKNLFNDIDSDILPRQTIGAINNVLKRSSPWSQSKSVGEGVIPTGDPRAAWSRLHQYCQTIGLYIIEHGELESFDGTIGGHGQKWVNEVLKLDLVNDTRLEKARAFTSRFFDT